MLRNFRLLVGSLAVAGLLSACSQDAVSPNGALTPRLSGGSGGGGGSTSGGGSTGGGSTGGGSTGGGGGKTSCTNTLSVSAAATEALTGNSFSATYVLNSCQSKTRVSMRATDLSTGAVVWQSVADLAGTIAIWTLPYNLTTYRIDATAVAGSTNTVVATASTTVSTLDPLPCTPFVHETATSGYWGIYAAIWLATDAQDCGLGGTVSLRVHNMNTDRDELNYANVGMSSFIDFEGPIVSYDTPYQVYVELRSRSGELLDSKQVDIRSAVLK